MKTFQMHYLLFFKTEKVETLCDLGCGMGSYVQHLKKNKLNVSGPEDRVNFLNYYYTVYKLCELLEQKEFLPFFPMLKDREKTN